MPLNMRLSYILLLLCLLQGCASYSLKIDRQQTNWQEAAIPPSDALTQRVYLIGDAGNAQLGSVPPVLRHLEKALAKESEQSSIVFVGDNIYPSGLPKKSNDLREQGEHRLQVQIDAVADFPGKVYFLPGNHDWYKYGIDGLDRQRRFLENGLDRKKVWQPKVGCGGPEVIEVNEDIVFVFIDTQWWLANWKKHPNVNDGCDATNRTTFLRLFKDAVKGNKEKQVVVFMHHPMETYGPHGGHFPLTDHLFPLRRTVNPNLWLPLPVLGSIMPFYRSNAGTKQDVVHPAFKELKTALLAEVQLNGNATFVSGHEHSLQYIEKDNQRYIVSGSGSKAAPVGMGLGSHFAYGGLGYATLDFYANGSQWVSFWGVSETGDKADLLYRKEIVPAGSTTQAVVEFPEHEAGLSTKIRPMIDQNFERKGFGRMILGDHYRTTYSLDVELPVLDLSTFKGGLKTVKKGGGNQTQSIRLEAADGRQYSMRSLEKDPSATVGYDLSQSAIVRNIVSDAFTASHPLSALPVVGLAGAVGVSHTNPAVYYIPVQPALNQYNEQFGGAVYLVEERPDDNLWQNYPSFGAPKDIVSTPKMLEKIRQHHDHVLDHSSMARARAFDLLLGDWDRHDDQWRWAVHEVDDRTYYRPIPRDRDQAFSHYDGTLLGFTRLLAGEMRPLAPFREHPKSVHWMTHGNRFFDATFLAGIEWATWEKEVSHIQDNLSDEVIEQAFADAWPAEVLALDGPFVIHTVKQRRDNLLDMARQLYLFRAKSVDVVGTDKKDLFEFHVAPNGDVLLQVYDSDKKGNKQGTPVYERLFLKGETKQLIVFGLEGDDFFSFKGNRNPGMRIRLIGGEGEDELMQGEEQGGRPLGKVLYYDYVAEEEETKWNDVKGVADRTSNNPKYHTYSRLSPDRNYNFFSFLPTIGANPDNGLLIGGSGSYTHYGFRKAPFAGRHTFSAQYAMATSGGQIGYRGEFTDAIGSAEIVLDAAATNSLYAVNFYGFGNETVNTEDQNGIDYHRVRQQFFHISPLLARHVNQATDLFFGPSYLRIRTDNTPGRFITEQADGLTEETFDFQHIIQLKARLEYDNYDSPVYPTNGMRLSAEAGFNFNLEEELGNDFPYIKGALSLAQKVDKGGAFVIASRIGFEHLFQEDFQYFQAATLGGAGPNANLRGFRRERFSGQTAFYFSNDVRIRLIDSRNLSLPFSMGVLGGFDLGRVWFGDDDEIRLDNDWHTSLGGGIWISPVNLAIIKVSLFKGDNGKGRILFGGGFFF